MIKNAEWKEAIIAYFKALLHLPKKH